MVVRHVGFRILVSDPSTSVGGEPFLREMQLQNRFNFSSAPLNPLDHAAQLGDGMTVRLNQGDAMVVRLDELEFGMHEVTSGERTYLFGRFIADEESVDRPYNGYEVRDAAENRTEKFEINATGQGRSEEEKERDSETGNGGERHKSARSNIGANKDWGEKEGADERSQTNKERGAVTEYTKANAMTSHQRHCRRHGYETAVETRRRRSTDSMQRAFGIMDVDGDGRLSFAEVAAVLTSFGEAGKEAQRALFNLLGGDAHADLDSASVNQAFFARYNVCKYVR